MGQAADDILSGKTCSICGQFHDKFLETGKGYGYPKACRDCEDDDE